jgi:hypothetical protein
MSVANQKGMLLVRRYYTYYCHAISGEGKCKYKYANYIKRLGSTN